MLLWSTGEVLHRRADAACDFLQEALHLEEYEDWRVQRCAFRTAIEWFFSNAHGRAWIAAVPNKPGSGEALKACGAKYLSSSLVGECLGLGKRVRNVKDLGIGLPPLPIKGFRFAYRTAKHPRTEFVVRPWERELLTRAGGKYVERQRDLFTANPIEDEKLIHDGLYMLEPDAIYDSVRRRYKTPHIWLSKVPLFAPKSVTQLCLVLQRDTAQMIGIATYRRALDSLLLQQPIDRGMLGAAGAIL
jgi:hypothetical protein